ncbi:MAG: hypothetical protein AB7E47_07195 [Desulfovibrionaceae bacterium]
MSELTIESLGLKKSLDKMTAKELRDVVINKLPMITGATGMSKEELVPAIKEVLGIVDDGENKVSPYKAQIGTLKRTIKGLRADRVSASTRKDREIIRKKINKLKKRTRRLAAATA